MKKLTAFYDRYHQKNHHFSGVIRQGNFTYWYTLNLLHAALPSGFKRKRVLDVGCGVGAVAMYLAAQGADVTGVDVSGRAIQIARKAKQRNNLKNIEFIEGEVKIFDKRFDVVTCFEVLEHVADEKKFLRTIKKNLKPNGVLVLSTPSLSNILYRLGFYKKFDAEVGHLRRYSEVSLRHLLEKQGLQVLYLRSVEGPLRNILFTTRLGFLIKGIRGPLVPLFHWFDEVSGKVFGFSDIQVVVK